MSDGNSLMLAGPVPTDNSWKVEQNGQTISYKMRLVSTYHQTTWHIEFYDKAGHLLTRTQNIGTRLRHHTIPFPLFAESNDLSRRMAATFNFNTMRRLRLWRVVLPFDKRGNMSSSPRVTVRVRRTNNMYKPIPFF
jgi:hypothetical protein